MWIRSVTISEVLKHADMYYYWDGYLTYLLSAIRFLAMLAITLRQRIRLSLVARTKVLVICRR